jgi:hypothetical protein
LSFALGAFAAAHQLHHPQRNYAICFYRQHHQRVEHAPPSTCASPDLQDLALSWRSLLAVPSDVIYIMAIRRTSVWRRTIALTRIGDSMKIQVRRLAVALAVAGPLAMAGAAQSSAAPMNGKSIKAAAPAAMIDVRYRPYWDYSYASYWGYPTYYYYGGPDYWTYSPYWRYPQYYYYYSW